MSDCLLSLLLVCVHVIVFNITFFYITGKKSRFGKKDDTYNLKFETCSPVSVMVDSILNFVDENVKNTHRFYTGTV